MAAETRLIYRSSNGDQWYLVRDSTGRVFVRHEPNRPSGGRVSEIDLGTFLGAGGHGPEQQELQRLIGTLVELPAKATVSVKSKR
jgi:hypothetical protein